MESNSSPKSYLVSLKPTITSIHEELQDPWRYTKEEAATFQTRTSLARTNTEHILNDMTAHWDAIVIDETDAKDLADFDIQSHSQGNDSRICDSYITTQEVEEAMMVVHDTKTTVMDNDPPALLSEMIKKIMTSGRVPNNSKVLPNETQLKKMCEQRTWDQRSYVFNIFEREQDSMRNILHHTTVTDKRVYERDHAIEMSGG